MDNRDFYNSSIYNTLENAMNDPAITNEFNNKVSNYISENLSGQMYGNPTGQGYNNYTIPDKFKNGNYTLDELFTSASEQFGVPKDVLVAVSQHECGQEYQPINSYTGYRENNCGGMMGIVDLDNMEPGFLPQGGYDGTNTTNPALTVYTAASSLKFNYDYFKDLDLGYGLDGWDNAIGIYAVGVGNFRNSEMGFTKQSSDYITNLNTVMPEYKALREAYNTGELGVKDLTINVSEGTVQDWTNGDNMIYKTDTLNEVPEEPIVEEKTLPKPESAKSSAPNDSEIELQSSEVAIDFDKEPPTEKVETEESTEEKVTPAPTKNATKPSGVEGYSWSGTRTKKPVAPAKVPSSTASVASPSASVTSPTASVDSSTASKSIPAASSHVTPQFNNLVGATKGLTLGALSAITGGFIGVRTSAVESLIKQCRIAMDEVISALNNYNSVFIALEDGWKGQALENFKKNFEIAVNRTEKTLDRAYIALAQELIDIANALLEEDKGMVELK